MSEIEYFLKFECCGNELPLGFEPTKGDHGEYCLACDTSNPPTEIVTAEEIGRS